MTPDLTVPAHKQTKEWYLNCVKYFAAYYNVNSFFFSPSRGESALTPMQRILRCYEYYFGVQDVYRYNAIINKKDSDGNPIGYGALYTNENQIFLLIQQLRGKISERIRHGSPTATLLSENAKTKKELDLTAIDFQFKQDQVMKLFSEIGLFPDMLQEDIKIESVEDLEAYKETGYRQKGAIYSQRIAEQLRKINQLDKLFEEVYTDMKIAGVGAKESFYRNGLLISERVNPSELLLDRTSQDSLGNDDKFRGRVKFNITPAEVISWYGDQLTTEEIAEIKKNATTPVSDNWLTLNPISPYGSFNMYVLNTAQLITGYTSVKVYFKALYDPRYNTLNSGKIVKLRDYDESGKPVMTKNKKGKEVPKTLNIRGSEEREVWYQAEWIGGKYMVNMGVCPNAMQEGVLNQNNTCPLQVVKDDFMMRYQKSAVERVMSLQDRISFCQWKIDEAMAFDNGKSHFFNSKKMIGLELNRIEDDFRRYRKSIGQQDPDDDENMAQALVETIDETINLSTVQVYTLLIDKATDTMRQILSLPTQAIGQQNSVIGKGVQAQTVALSSAGLLPSYNLFEEFMNKCYEYDVNGQKIAFYADNNEYARVILGDDGFRWVENNWEYANESIGIGIDSNDIITSDRRVRFDAMIERMIASKELSSTAWVKLERIKDLREAEALFMAMEKKKEKQRIAEMQAQLQAAAQNTQMQAQATVEKGKVAADAVKESTAMKTQASKDVAQIDAGAKINNNQRDAEVKLATHESKVA